MLVNVSILNLFIFYFSNFMIFHTWNIWNFQNLLRNLLVYLFIEIYILIELQILEISYTFKVVIFLMKNLVLYQNFKRRPILLFLFCIRLKNLKCIELLKKINICKMRFLLRINLIRKYKSHFEMVFFNYSLWSLIIK